MNTKELKFQLKRQPFEPFDLISSSGERYPVRHPELIHLTDRGTVYVFHPSPERGERIVTGPDVLSMMHISSLEPMRDETGTEAAADENG